MNEPPHDEVSEPASLDEIEAALDADPEDSIVDTLGDASVSELGQGAIAQDLLKSAPSGSNIYLIFSTGQDAKILGHVEGTVNFGHTRTQGDEGTISTWYRGCVEKEPNDGALIAAVAFMPMGPVRKQRQAAKLLAATLGLGPPSLADTFADSLVRIGARVQIETSPFTGREIEGAQLHPPERADVRHHLWAHVLRFEEILSPWVCEQGGSGDADVSMRTGLAVGDLTSALADTPSQLRRMFKEIVEVWAANGGHARHALGQALRVAVSHPAAARLLAARLETWTAPQSPTLDLKKALNICRSSWAVDHPTLALGVLRRIEPRARGRSLFFGVQSAISTMWLGASLLRNEQRGLAALVAQTLSEWSAQDEASVFFNTPQQRIAYAIDHELLRSVEIPLVLDSALDRGELAFVVARLFAIGLRRESTRRDIETTLSRLMAHADAHGQGHAYQAFVSIMQEAGFVLSHELGGPAPGPLFTLARFIEDRLRRLPAPLRPYLGAGGDTMNWAIPVGWLLAAIVLLSLLLLSL